MYKYICVFVCVCVCVCVCACITLHADTSAWNQQSKSAAGKRAHAHTEALHIDRPETCSSMYTPFACDDVTRRAHVNAEIESSTLLQREDPDR